MQLLGRIKFKNVEKKKQIELIICIVLSVILTILAKQYFPKFEIIFPVLFGIYFVERILPKEKLAKMIAKILDMFNK